MTKPKDLTALPTRRIGYRPDEFSKLTGLGRSTVFELIRKGQIKAITFGKRAKVIPASEVDRLLGRTPTEALAFLSTTLTNRLLHGPSSALRDAAQSGDAELLRTAMRLLHLDRTPDE